jgi:hypothetical protein
LINFYSGDELLVTIALGEILSMLFEMEFPRFGKKRMET